ncbi:DUF2164 domain-containing protein [Klebsiella variicola]|uniref:DUF2164 domain-containing protein n=1 Tax=Klebsiella variicola TaxID=244366 RepID=UPI0003BF49AC|nr:DUF2164 family protein [Klebsiella variicola]ESN40839.1 hypothetical protein L366_03254 [Klebsiella variicola]
MSEINLTKEEKDIIRTQLVAYCNENFNLSLEQFDAEFFTDFIIKTLGIPIYNAGIEEAIKTHRQYSERVQEEMDLKRVL